MDTSQNGSMPEPPTGPTRYNWPEWAVWIVTHIKRLIGCVDALDAKVDEHDKCLIKLKASAEHHPEPCPAAQIKADLLEKINAEITKREVLARDVFWRTSIIGVIAGAIPSMTILIILAIRWLWNR